MARTVVILGSFLMKLNVLVNIYRLANLMLNIFFIL
jgi:hypothetical protein